MLWLATLSALLASVAGALCPYQALPTTFDSPAYLGSIRQEMHLQGRFRTDYDAEAHFITFTLERESVFRAYVAPLDFDVDLYLTTDPPGDTIATVRLALRVATLIGAREFRTFTDSQSMRSTRNWAFRRPKSLQKCCRQANTSSKFVTKVSRCSRCALNRQHRISGLTCAERVQTRPFCVDCCRDSIHEFIEFSKQSSVVGFWSYWASDDEACATVEVEIGIAPKDVVGSRVSSDSTCSSSSGDKFPPVPLNELTTDKLLLWDSTLNASSSEHFYVQKHADPTPSALEKTVLLLHKYTLHLPESISTTYWFVEAVLGVDFISSGCVVSCQHCCCAHSARLDRLACCSCPATIHCSRCRRCRTRLPVWKTTRAKLAQRVITTKSI